MTLADIDLSQEGEASRINAEQAARTNFSASHQNFSPAYKLFIHNQARGLYSHLKSEFGGGTAD